MSEQGENRMENALFSPASPPTNKTRDKKPEKSTQREREVSKKPEEQKR